MVESRMADSLISTAELAASLSAPEIKVVDASYKMPGVIPTAGESYLAAHIPGAVFFDIDAIADRKTHLPHMLPSAEFFAAQVQALGIGNEHRIVLYDAGGIAGAARAWWTFRVFGHSKVAVLDGGLRKWVAEGRSVDAAIPRIVPSRFTARFNSQLVRAREQVLANINTRQEQVLDARSSERFEGRAQEPWPGRRSGHIPGSLNLDHTTLVNAADGSLKSAAELRKLFEAAGVHLDEPIVTSCGSGITASVLAFALHLLGSDQAAVYDGSWAEWGLRGELPIETGPAAASRQFMQRREV
jgi:thiosulfate/3-mercaptopyruvate sulfurtransferase